MFELLAYQDHGADGHDDGHGDTHEAAHGGAHGPEHASGPVDLAWLPAVTSLLVFVIAFLILRAKVWPQITKGLDDRDQKIRDEIAAAEEAREQAKAALEEYERNLASAREEANQMIAQARSDAKSVADELRTRNETQLADMKERASRDIASAKQAAIAELHAQAATLAASIATKILSREISAEDQQRLVDESLRELSGIGDGN